MSGKIWTLTKREYISFLYSKKTFLMLFSLVFFSEDVVGKMVELSVETGMSINKLEPYLLIFSYTKYALIVPVMFAVLLSNFPVRENSGMFSIVRMGRKAWMLGELLYALFAGLTYLLLLLLGSILAMGQTGVFANQWSSYTTDFYSQYPERFAENAELFIGAGTTTQGTPFYVLIQGMILMLLNLFFLAQLQMAFKMIGQKTLGLFTVIAITVFGAVGVNYFGILKWIFPMAHAIYGTHFREFLAKPECSLGVSYIYFVVLNLIAFMLNLVLVKNVRIGDDTA